MPNDPQNAQDPAASVRAKIAEIDARIDAVAAESGILRQKQPLTADEDARLTALLAEEAHLLGVSTNLGLLLAKINDSSPKIDKIRKLTTLVRDQANKSAAAIANLPGHVASGAAAAPKALDGIEKVLKPVEAKHGT